MYLYKKVLQCTNKNINYKEKNTQKTKFRKKHKTQNKSNKMIVCWYNKWLKVLYRIELMELLDVTEISTGHNILFGW